MFSKTALFRLFQLYFYKLDVPTYMYCPINKSKPILKSKLCYFLRSCSTEILLKLWFKQNHFARISKTDLSNVIFTYVAIRLRSWMQYVEEYMIVVVKNLCMWLSSFWLLKITLPNSDSWQMKNWITQLVPAVM